MRLQTSGQHRSMPWANGRGTTAEIAAWPSADDWTWRLSLATVDHDGPFSSLPGVDRWLVVAEGVGMRLTVDGLAHEVLRHEVIRFSGDAATTCELLDGTVRDLNLMVSEAVHTGRLDVRRVEAGSAIDVDALAAVVVLDGVVESQDGGTARAGDAFLEPAGSLRATTPCVVALATISAR